MEQGIIYKNLLTLRKEPFPNVESNFLIAYKHYIFTFDRHGNQNGGDCVVFDTDKGTSMIVNSGLNIPERAGYSFCHWKDNIYVIFGGHFYRRAGQDPDAQRNEGQDLRVHFLSVIENDGQISFAVESWDSTDLEWWDVDHSAHIYQDKMYIFGNGLQSDNEMLKKFDLNERTWSRCQATGDIPKPCYAPNVRLNSKIYFFGGSASGGEGLFGNSRNRGLFGGQTRRGEGLPQQALDLFVLDLENMQWQKVQTDDFARISIQRSFQAEGVGDKIYLSQKEQEKFFIYDPAKNKLFKSKDFPPHKNWRIRSFEDHSIIFRIYRYVDQKTYIKYYNFATSTQSEQQKKGHQVFLVDPLVATVQQLPHMEYLWKEKPFADITFVVQNEEIPAHRIILLKCRYFQNMLNSGMMEANSNRINVPDISPSHFKSILEYIYCDKIDLTESLAMELIILADMYFLPSLKADCEKYLSEKVTVTNFVAVMKVAQTADSEKLEKRVVSFLTSNIEKVRKEIDISLIPQDLLFKAIMDLKANKK